MNPFYPSDELYFQISSSNYNYSLPNQTIPEDQIFHDPVIYARGQTPSPTQMEIKGKKREKVPSLGTQNEKKKHMHREIEKQRRQEMANLCATFRSLLPLEYIKGKRSISDHMHEGTKYIKHLQNKVQKLQAKRDDLMKLSNLSAVSCESGSFTNNHSSIYVIVDPCSEGVHIECSYSFRKHEFPLSRVLDILLKEGLNVVHCTSTKTDDDRFIHTVRSEDSQMMGEVNYTELQRKLVAAISSSSSEERSSEPEKY